MLRLFNSFGKKIEIFRPVNKKVVNIFTCGPSVYQRAHIGNMRTFLFEDTLVRYLEYLRYKVRRGMNITDVEDKAIVQAEKEKLSLKKLTDRNIEQFISEMRILKMKIPDYLPRASEHVDQTVEVIQKLISKKIAYWHNGSVYFDPLKFKGFGRLFGLDMSKWPKKKKRFHKDTYPGIQWNRGDFILWHGYKKEEKYYWNTKIGKGRPAWNVQDPSMIAHSFKETLSVYCGGVDNLYRHHDYTLAILESVRNYPMAKFWLHCQHLFLNGKKMSKSKGNIIYVDHLIKKRYSASEIRFLLTYGHYKEKLNFSDKNMKTVLNKLKGFKKIICAIREKAENTPSVKCKAAIFLKKTFIEHMNNDLNVKSAFDNIYDIIAGINVDELKSEEASDIIKTLFEMDTVLRVIE